MENIFMAILLEVALLKILRTRHLKKAKLSVREKGS